MMELQNTMLSETSQTQEDNRSQMEVEIWVLELRRTRGSWNWSVHTVCMSGNADWKSKGYIKRDSSPPGGRTFPPYIPLPHTHLQRGNVFQTHFTWGKELEKKKLTSGWSSQSPGHQSLSSEWTMWSVMANWVSALHLSCPASELEVPNICAVRLMGLT